MAVTKAARTAYNTEIKDIKKSVDNLKKQIREIEGKKRKLKNIESYLNMEIAALYLMIVEDYLKMNELSLEMLSIKNEKMLTEARKEFYKGLQVMEDVVGNQIDRSLRENDEYLIHIKTFTPKQILAFVDKVHRIFTDIREKVGESSKWKWSFVELQARVAVITKNITNFSELARIRDPREEFFYDRRDLSVLCKDSLAEAAKQYRTKYELSGKARDDLKKSIEFLSSLRKIHVLFGEDQEASRLKTTIDAAKQALNAKDIAEEQEKKDKK